MTEKPLDEQHIDLLDQAALSLADAQAAGRKAQELQEQLAAGRSAVETLIASLFASQNASAAFSAAADAAEEMHDRVEEQLEGLDDRLDAVFDALSDGAAPAAPPALPESFSLPAGIGSLSDLAADVEAELQQLDAEPAADEPGIVDTLHQTLLQISAELAELNLLADEPVVEEEAVVDAVIVDEAAAAAAAAMVAQLVAELEEPTEEPVEEPAEEPVQQVSMPLQEVAADRAGYNPTWMALQQPVAAAPAEPAEAATAPLAAAAEKGEGSFAPAWFKATEEKEAATAVKPAPAAEPAPAAPVVDEDDPVEAAARALEARRLQEETEKMAAQLAEAERMRLKAEEELRRILQEIEGEKRNDADDDIAAALRGFRN